VQGAVLPFPADPAAPHRSEGTALAGTLLDSARSEPVPLA
jgi:hypothetical protein